MVVVRQLWTLRETTLQCLDAIDALSLPRKIEMLQIESCDLHDLSVLFSRFVYFYLLLLLAVMLVMMNYI